MRKQVAVRRPVVLVSVNCPIHGQKRKAKPPWHVCFASLPCVVDENLLAMPQLCADCGREVEMAFEPVEELALAAR